MSMTARLGVDISPYARGLAQAQNLGSKWAADSARDMKSRFTGALGGAALAGTTAAFVHGIVEKAEALKDFSEQMDVTTDEAQRLELASKEVGLGLNDWSVALRTVGEFRKKVAQGDEDAIRLARKYQLNLENVTNAERRNIEVVKELGDAIRNRNLNARDRNELKEFFGGRSGEKFAAVLGNMGNQPAPFSPKALQEIDKAAKEWEKATIQAQAKSAPFLASYMTTLSELASGNWRGALDAYADTTGKTFMGLGGGVPGILLRSFGFGKKGGGGMLPGAGMGMGSSPSRSSLAGGYVRIADDEVTLKAQRDVADAYTKLYEAAAKTRFAGMSPGAQLRELDRQRNNALVEASHYAPGTKEHAEALTRAEGLRGDIIARRRELARGGLHGDALTAVGNFLGDGGQQTQRIENELRQIRDNTAKMANRTTVGGEMPDSAF